jgi:hypothetical protein
MPTDSPLTVRKTDREEAVLQQVIQQVEPLTRFDRSLFKDIATATELIAVTAWQRYTALLRVDRESGAGGVPKGTVLLSSAAAMQAYLDQELLEARRDLPTRLRHWLDAQETVRPDARLLPRDCFTETAPAGYHYPCVACGATGSITCGNCQGNRQVTCDNCHGQGTAVCASCNGGRQTCGSCGGRGSWLETRSRTTSTGTHGDQVQTTEYYNETVTCFSCGGTGSQTCFSCGGSARVTCGTCGGSCKIGCPTCGARGELACRPCGATGWLYERGQLRLLITLQFSAQAQTDRDEIRKTVADFEELGDLYTLARGVTCLDDSAGPNTAYREFTAMVDVTTLTVKAGSDSYEILGYGNPPQIFDFKNIVGHLLEADLQKLETVLQASSRFSFGISPWLTGALSAFLASEANARIAGRIRAGLTPAQAEQIVISDFRRTVSTGYVMRAATAIRASIERIYWGQTRAGVLGVLLLPIAFLVPADYFHWIEFGPLPALIAGIIGFGAALILEQFGKQSIEQLFGAALGDSLQGVLEDSGILRKGRRALRGSAVIGALLGWIGGAVVLAIIFTVQHQPRPTKSSPAAHQTTSPKAPRLR